MASMNASGDFGQTSPSLSAAWRNVVLPDAPQRFATSLTEARSAKVSADDPLPKTTLYRPSRMYSSRMHSECSHHK